MKIPNKVKIGGYLYSIERPEEPFLSGDVVCDGIHDFVNQKIKVSKAGSKAYQDTVFLHEICHSIIAHYCSGSSSFDEECFVEAFSKGLYQAIADNPEVFDNVSSA